MGGAPGAYTEAGPPDKMQATGERFKKSSSEAVAGMISE
jgi:hypothetical protein